MTITIKIATSALLPKYIESAIRMILEGLTQLDGHQVRFESLKVTEEED